MAQLAHQRRIENVGRVGRQRQDVDEHLQVVEKGILLIVACKAGHTRDLLR
ncbi:hypothetical protein D3C78_1864580 [compost metagenome]